MGVDDASMTETNPVRQAAIHPAAIRCAECPLRRLKVFSAMDREQVDFIQTLKSGEVFVAARGTVFREGETPERLHTVLSGWAFRYKTLPDGRRQILNIVLPGDLVGLQAKLFDEAPHGLEALTELRLCVFSRARLFDVFRAHPAIGYDVTWLGAREEAMIDETLLSVGRRSALESLSAMIFRLVSRGVALGLGTAANMPFPLTQTHIADALGLSAIHTNRTMGDLRRKRLFALSGQTLRDVDLPRLMEMAGITESGFDTRPLI